jgi:hypothetical protein
MSTTTTTTNVGIDKYNVFFAWRGENTVLNRNNPFSASYRSAQIAFDGWPKEYETSRLPITLDPKKVHTLSLTPKESSTHLNGLRLTAQQIEALKMELVIIKPKPEKLGTDEVNVLYFPLEIQFKEKELKSQQDYCCVITREKVVFGKKEPKGKINATKPEVSNSSFSSSSQAGTSTGGTSDRTVDPLEGLEKLITKTFFPISDPAFVELSELSVEELQKQLKAKNTELISTREEFDRVCTNEADPSIRMAVLLQKQKVMNEVLSLQNALQAKGIPQKDLSVYKLDG